MLKQTGGSLCGGFIEQWRVARKAVPGCDEKKEVLVSICVPVLSMCFVVAFFSCLSPVCQLVSTFSLAACRSQCLSVSMCCKLSVSSVSLRL